MDNQPQAESQQAQEASAEELQAQELEKLEQSFTKVSRHKAPLEHEQALVKESRDLSIPLDEYRRLYELSRKKSSTLKTILDRLWKWTGFGEKKLWDILQLLLVPLFIYVATNYLQEQAKQREKKAAEDRANQETLNSYLDIMTKLLPELRQRTTPANVEQVITIRVLAKTRTITALRILDSERSNLLLGFLREAKLIGGEPSLEGSRIDFRYANLRAAALKNADLSGINLSNVVLADADLRDTKLIGANLSDANLTGAKLEGANLSNADLSRAALGAIDQLVTNFCGARMPPKGEKNTQGCLRYVNAGTGLFVRDKPAGKSIGVLEHGQDVLLTGETYYAVGRTWSQLTNGGWVVTDYLSIQPPENTSSSVPPI